MKLFIITGTNRGLGKALADALLGNDDNFVLSIGRSMSSKQRTFLDQKKENFLFAKVDLNYPQLIAQALYQTLGELVDKHNNITFINNASTIKPIGKTGTAIDSEIVSSINVNVLSPTLICNYILSRALTKKIYMVNISSGAAKRPIIGWSLYCSSKAFLNMYFDVVEMEYSNEKSVRTINIDPGVIDTLMQEEIRTASEKQLHNGNRLIEVITKDKLQKPEDAAEKIIKKITE